MTTGRLSTRDFRCALLALRGTCLPGRWRFTDARYAWKRSDCLCLHGTEYHYLLGLRYKALRAVGTAPHYLDAQRMPAGCCCLMRGTTKRTTTAKTGANFYLLPLLTTAEGPYFRRDLCWASAWWRRRGLGEAGYCHHLLKRQALTFCLFCTYSAVRAVLRLLVGAGLLCWRVAPP